MIGHRPPKKAAVLVQKMARRYDRCERHMFLVDERNARADQRLVSDKPEGEVDQDRCENRQPWPLCRVLDGRSRHSQKSLRRHPTNDRRTLTAARPSACMKCSVVMRSSQN